MSQAFQKDEAVVNVAVLRIRGTIVSWNKLCCYAVSVSVLDHGRSLPLVKANRHFGLHGESKGKRLREEYELFFYTKIVS